MKTAQQIRSIADLERIKQARQAERGDGTGRIELHLCMGASCIASGAEALRDAVQESLAADKPTGEGRRDSERAGSVRVVETGCMGPCSRGPLLRVLPDGSTLSNVSAEEAGTLATALANGDSQSAGEIKARAKAASASTAPASAELSGAVTAAVDAAAGEPAGDTMQRKIALRNCGRIDPNQIEDYIAEDGYRALARLLKQGERDTIIDDLKTAGLRGRGGAGFPTWMKWQFTRKAEGDRKYVLCNADEGDPGAFMDRSLLEGDPHSIIEGMAIAAYAVGASRGFVYVRAEYPLAVTRLENAIGQARSYGILGSSMLGSGVPFDLEIRRGSGAFVCGEETALMHSIEGKRGEPRPRPPFPAQRGLWNRPSLLNNVETYANIAAIFLNGPAAFAEIGTAESKGTKVFALAGAVENTGLVEVPIGTTLGELIYDIGGGIKNGRPFKAAQIGGPSGGCIPREHLNVQLDYESLQELGAIMGSGGLIVMDDETCMVDVARFFLEFVQEESCGKCVPCRVGTKRMLEILTRICEGDGRSGDIERLEELGARIKDTALCGLGQTAPNPVLSTIRHFREEYVQHIRDKHCDAGICAALVRAPCQSACPAGVDVPGFVSLTAERRYAEALRLHRERNPFAAVCARVCFHTCEEHCRRASIDDPVAIRAIKRFMVDQEITIQHPEVRENAENARRRVAIIGAGPAGLSCGYFLARLGYKPVVFEAEERPGGMLVQTIPAYRLPRETLAREIRMIEQLGVEIKTGVRLGRDIDIEELRNEGYEAVFFGVGAPQSVEMGVPGEDADGVVMAGDFLRAYNIRGSVPVGKQVVVIGGGNAAIDAARTSLRLGAERVSIVYRRTREQMPAYTEEIEEAVLEGVELHTLTQPIAVETVPAAGNDPERHRPGASHSSAVTGVRCAPMQLGEFDRSGRRRPRKREEESVVLPADQVIVAIGQRLDPTELLGTIEVELNEAGFIAVDPVTGQTSTAWLFAGGDAASGPASVVTAIGAGERAAVGIDTYLTGNAHAFWRQEANVDTAFDPDAEPAPYPREKMRTIEAERRRHNFDEVELAWQESVAIRQSKRCLRCDYGKSPVKPVEEVTHV